jgi:hypothetical protein
MDINQIKAEIDKARETAKETGMPVITATQTPKEDSRYIDNCDIIDPANFPPVSEEELQKTIKMLKDVAEKYDVKPIYFREHYFEESHNISFNCDSIISLERSEVPSQDLMFTPSVSFGPFFPRKK